MRRLLALPALFLALAGPASAALNIYAAASLTGVFPAINGSEHYQFGGSDQLYAQIAAGAPADVFASASPKWTQLALAKGLVSQPVTFATNRLVLVVPPSNPAGIHSVFDLRRKGIRLVVGAAAVPIGSYTRQILKNLGLSGVLSNVVSNEPDVRSILGKVALGEADAGFVYQTDARTADVKAITLPAWAQPPVRYEIAVLKSSPNQAAAQAFVRRVLSKAGRALLVKAGFGVPWLGR